MQHNESSTLHTLAPSGELIKGLVKAVKVALNEKYEFFLRKIGALPILHNVATRKHHCRRAEEHAWYVLGRWARGPATLLTCT